MYVPVIFPPKNGKTLWQAKAVFCFCLFIVSIFEFTGHNIQLYTLLPKKILQLFAKYNNFS